MANTDGTTEVTGGYAVDDEDYNDDGGTTLASLGISWVTDLRILTTKPAAWIVAALTAFSIQEAAQKMANGESAAELIVEQYLYRQLIRPSAVAIWEAGLATLDSVLTIFFGGDHALGVPPGSQVGIADLPYVIYQPLTGAVNALADAGVNTVTQVNQGIAAELAFLGIAGPAIVTFFWLIEIGGLIWAIWLLINAVDPGVVVPTAKAIARPLRNLMEWFYD